MSNQVATFIGAANITVTIKGKLWHFHPLTMRDMHEFSAEMDEFNRNNELRMDYAAELRRWEKYRDQYEEALRKGEPAGAAPGPKPEKPAGYSTAKFVDYVLTMLWAAIRKDGLSDAQVKAREWTLAKDELFDLVEWNQIEEVNEALKLFFGRTMSEKKPSVDATSPSSNKASPPSST